MYFDSILVLSTCNAFNTYIKMTTIYILNVYTQPVCTSMHAHFHNLFTKLSFSPNYEHLLSIDKSVLFMVTLWLSYFSYFQTSKTN